jgi:uncharacterized membrane protein
MISVAGVTFSITIATVSLTSSQLGPRLLNNFMRDRGNQIVLGTFIAIFTYCLLVLRTIRSRDETTFVPYLSVVVAILLSIISLWVLVYFFHHVSQMIQAQNMIAGIGHDLEISIERLFADQAAKTPYQHELDKASDIPLDFDKNANFLAATTGGYIQSISYDSLQEIAEDHNLLLRLLYRPGDFVVAGSEIIALYPATVTSESVAEEIYRAFTLGTRRLRLQDIEFSIDQLVEVAVRALSPGINDPFTAIACLDQLGATLSTMATRSIPSGYYYDDEGQLRLISKVVTFGGVVNAAFDQIRQHGKSDVAVMIRLLETLTVILTRTTSAEQRQALTRQAEMVKRTSDKIIPEENDRHDITKRYDRFLRNLNHLQTVADSYSG